MKKNLLAVLAVLIIKATFAQAPSWTVNPGQFQYNMSVVALVSVNCQELSNNSNMLGAFVNGSCRGVAYTNSIVNGKHLAYLLINSNSVAGETVLLKYYDVATDSIYNCKVSILFSDNSSLGTNNSPFNVRNNDAPTALSLSNSIIPENTTVGTSVSTVSTIDSDLADTHSYTLVAGNGSADNSKFQITGNQLVLNALVNYSIQDTLLVRLRVTDNNGCYFEKECILQVVNVNDAPTAIMLSDTSVFENVLNPAVGSFLALDVDANETFTYSLVSGIGNVDNGSFSISGTNLNFVGTANYEVKNTYSIRCRVTDLGGLFFEKVFTILVKDVNDNPTNLLLSNNKVFENEPANQFVAKLSTIDQDVNDVFTYTFANIGTNNNTSFAISNDTLIADQLFDFETKNSYVVYITTTDSAGLFFTKSFTILIKDTLDAPTDMMISNATVSENAAFKTFVGKLTTVDANSPGPNVYVYSLVAGTGSANNSSFMVSNDSIYSQGVFDFETKNFYNIRVKTTLLNGMSFEKPIVINVLDEIDTVQNILLSSNSVNENGVSGIQVGVLSSVSQDNGGVFVYNLVSGTGSTDNALFAVNGAQLSFIDTADFELLNSYSVRISSTNGLGQSFEKAFTIGVSDINDKPANISVSNDTLTENAGSNFYIGDFTTTDQDTWDSFVYTFDNSILNDNADFTLLTTGKLFATQSFDFETKNVFTLSIKSTDIAGLSFVKQFTVYVTDTNEVPSALNSSVLEIFENVSAGATVGSFTTTDIDTLDTATYSLVSGAGSANNASFTISNNQLLSAIIFNYEQQNQYSIRVRTTDNGGLYIETSYVVSVLDANEIPTLITLSKDTIPENTADSSVVCVLSTTDQEGGSNFVYTLVVGSGDADNMAFGIVGDKLVLISSANFEVKNTYNVRIRTTDVSGGFYEMPFTIFVSDVNEQPEIDIADYTVSEAALIGNNFGTITVTELDNNQTQHFSIISSAVPFGIDSVSGALHIIGTVDYEVQKEYRILVVTKDDGIPSRADTALIKISVLDAIEENGFFPSVDFVSPNKDGINDFWQITNVDLYSDFSLKIADQNGQVVYKTDSNYQNEWDAYLNGSALPNGNYYYVFANSNTGRLYKGIITVVK
ncbi:MAG: cadherin domain-containing protein [Bacteroidota bacterium]